MFAYHEATKHTLEKIYANRVSIDWANMPDPFRHYHGAPVIDLPADPPPPTTPALRLLRGDGRSSVSSHAVEADGAQWLSSLLFHTAAISATKASPGGSRYALRVNPSSGNLHPTEFHFAARGVSGWEDGLYHYRASAHMAEQRMRGGSAGRSLAELACSPWFRDCPLIFVLSSIAWREAWKYRDRAYRYCGHDIGHAWGALSLAARSLGAEAFAAGHFADEAVARLLHLDDEWPMLIVALQGGVPLEERPLIEATIQAGSPNVLSPDRIPYPLIDAIHSASMLDVDCGPVAQPAPVQSSQGEIELAALAESPEPFNEVVRRRRSALDFQGGNKTISFPQLSTLLDVATRPFAADFEGDLFGMPSARYIQLYLFIHRVDELERGLYRHHASTGTLECMATGDQRLMAAGLSLGQDLAANSCVTFSMIADLDRAACDHGNRGYRYVFFEAGMIGHRLYLAAEAMGFQSTGIGAFYDDSVHRYLDIEQEQGQVIYHFACGFAIDDPRLTL